MIKKWGPLVSWCLVIFILSGMPDLGEPMPGLWPFLLRKLAHVIEYLILYLLAYRAFGDKKQALAFCLLYAVSDEFHQHFIPMRVGCFRDVLVDGVGVVGGYLAVNKRALLSE